MGRETDITRTLTALMGDSKTTSDKLAAATEIPIRFIDALINGDFSKLPAEPYVRGYLKKIAKVLKADEDGLIASYLSSARAGKSGEGDKLPENRFQRIAISKGAILLAAAVILVSAFFFIRFDEILGLTSLEVNMPATATEELLVISGKITPGDRLTLNEEIVYTDETGAFETEVMLLPGLNNFEFRVKRFLGREKTIIKQIYYEPQNNG